MCPHPVLLRAFRSCLGILIGGSAMLGPACLCAQAGTGAVTPSVAMTVQRITAGTMVRISSNGLRRQGRFIDADSVSVRIASYRTGTTITPSATIDSIWTLGRSRTYASIWTKTGAVLGLVGGLAAGVYLNAGFERTTKNEQAPLLAIGGGAGLISGAMVGYAAGRLPERWKRIHP